MAWNQSTPAEDDMLVTVFDYVKRKQAQDWQWRNVFHVANERSTSDGERIRQWRKGTTAGIPDILVLYPSGNWSGAAIELKTPGGRLTKAQRETMLRLEWARFKPVMIQSVEETIEFLNEWLSN